MDVVSCELYTTPPTPPKADYLRHSDSAISRTKITRIALSDILISGCCGPFLLHRIH